VLTEQVSGDRASLNKICACGYFKSRCELILHRKVFEYVNYNIYRVHQKNVYTLTKENSVLYVSTNFNYTSQVEYTLQ